MGLKRNLHASDSVATLQAMLLYAAGDIVVLRLISCRWILKVLGFANRWYPLAVETAQDAKLLRTRACAEAMTNPDVAAAAELLFELNEPKLAETLIIEQAAELNGGFYDSLTSLVEKARNEGCFLAATLILRALLDAILKRAYAKAYGHGARYLRALQELGSRIDDYRGHPTHEVYEQTLRLAHGRKTSFWARFLEL